MYIRNFFTHITLSKEVWWFCRFQNIFDECHPSTKSPLNVQPAKLKLRLKPYQSASVNWMTEVERKAHNGEEWIHSCCYVVDGCKLFFDLLHQRILIPPVDARGPHGNIKISVKGGILAGPLCYVLETSNLNLIKHDSLWM